MYRMRCVLASCIGEENKKYLSSLSQIRFIGYERDQTLFLSMFLLLLFELLKWMLIVSENWEQKL